MKRLRTWLLPIATALVVLTVTVLLQHLSQRQYQKLMGCAHTEEMSAENNLPIQPPDLVQRMELLSRWMEDPAVMSVEHEPSDNTAYDELYAAVLEELHSLVDVGVLTSELMPLEVPVLSASRMYLQQQLVGAEYDVFDTYIKTENIHLWMVLDGETRLVLWLELGHPAMEKYYQSMSPAEIGVFFLDRLGVKNDLMTSGQYDAVFQLSETECQYAVSLDQVYLKLFPMMVYPETDAESTATAVG